MRWTPSTELTPREQRLCRRLATYRRFYRFLRLHRHRLFDDAFQTQLETMYSDKPRGQSPVPAALLATVTLLQAYTQASDEDAVLKAETDVCWQMVLDCVGAEHAPFCAATLSNFRARLLDAGLHHALLARTVALAKETKDFGSAQATRLRIALDAAPLEGAGKTEDTLNLLGHALRQLASVVAALFLLKTPELFAQADLRLLAAPSVKAGLDLDWDAPHATTLALHALLAEATKLTTWLAARTPGGMRYEAIERARAPFDHVLAQNTELGPDGARQMREGVAPDRQISLSDPEMRHGRKSETRRVDGFKRYLAVDVDSELVLGACVLPANVPEGRGAEALAPQLAPYGVPRALYVDRAFVTTRLALTVHDADDGRLVCRAPSSSQGGRFGKEVFRFDLEAGTVQCPAGQQAELRGDKTARFQASTCAACPLRSQCQKPQAKEGRTVRLHENEALFGELRARQATVEGRAELRERTVVEHALAHHTRRQGPRARYRGVAKNDLDACRTAAVSNLLVIDRRTREASSARVPQAA